MYAQYVLAILPAVSLYSAGKLIEQRALYKCADTHTKRGCKFNRLDYTQARKVPATSEGSNDVARFHCSAGSAAAANVKFYLGAEFEGTRMRACPKGMKIVTAYKLRWLLSRISWYAVNIAMQ